MKSMTVEIWACPTEGCGNYYADGRGLDLGQELNLESDLSHTVTTNPAKPRIVGNRGQCPDCKTRGIRPVPQRVLVRTVIRVPVAVSVAA